MSISRIGNNLPVVPLQVGGASAEAKDTGAGSISKSATAERLQLVSRGSPLDIASGAAEPVRRGSYGSSSDAAAVNGSDRSATAERDRLKRDLQLLATAEQDIRKIMEASRDANPCVGLNLKGEILGPDDGDAVIPAKSFLKEIEHRKEVAQKQLDELLAQAKPVGRRLTLVRTSG